MKAYYLEENEKLIGIQATLVKKHAKRVSVYEKFYNDIQTSPENTKLHLYYLILPRWIKYYERESYPQSQFYLGVQSGIDSKWKENIEFYALYPNDTVVLKYAQQQQFST